MGILGTRVVRIEDPLLLTTAGAYTDDLVDPRLQGALHLTSSGPRSRTPGSCPSTARGPGPHRALSRS